ncbi:uncharacterized protein LOC126849566 [Cataglyphis hispanica]|uniref:uncharacterized protein LOC126849566 n=1 Tax=Cataglyphis hispanica TaxID=1086592 RepID=UPI00217FB092|nr:uncharacterized protein LOC126849566 [Cataglyphis hispanica]
MDSLDSLSGLIDKDEYLTNVLIDARKACCSLIDIVANGLKYALIVTKSEYEKIKAIEQDEDKEPRIQELYRNKCKENTKNHGQRHINKIDFGDSNYKSVSKCEKKKSYTKPNSEEKHERHSRRNHRHHQNVTFKDTWSESGATTSDRQIKIIDEICEKKNVTTLHDTSPKKMIHNVTDNKMNDSIDLQQEKFIRNHKNYAAENTRFY